MHVAANKLQLLAQARADHLNRDANTGGGALLAGLMQAKVVSSVKGGWLKGRGLSMLHPRTAASSNGQSNRDVSLPEHATAASATGRFTRKLCSYTPSQRDTIGAEHVPQAGDQSWAAS